jgi:predicted RNase H-like nuclease (RuvC/YqgF family)|tara:strand:+ start:987 stop:1211 length:225 start_codon:yes stop_codon:yes gene_type:complete
MSIEIIAAKMQRQIKDLEHDQKIKRNMLLERDEEITNLKKELDKKQQLIDFLNKQLMEERKDNEKTRKNTRRKK